MEGEKGTDEFRTCADEPKNAADWRRALAEPVPQPLHSHTRPDIRVNEVANNVRNMSLTKDLHDSNHDCRARAHIRDRHRQTHHHPAVAHSHRCTMWSISSTLSMSHLRDMCHADLQGEEDDDAPEPHHDVVLAAHDPAWAGTWQMRRRHA